MKIMRILCKDNYDREGPGHDDRFVLHPMPLEDAQIICIILNRLQGEHSADYYCVVPMSYKLRVFEP